MADPKLKERTARFLRSLLPPQRKRGRPGIASVSKAIMLLQRFRRHYAEEKPEQTWKRIYPQAIPGYASMDRERQKAERRCCGSGSTVVCTGSETSVTTPIGRKFKEDVLWPQMKCGVSNSRGCFYPTPLGRREHAWTMFPTLAKDYQTRTPVSAPPSGIPGPSDCATRSVNGDEPGRRRQVR